MGTLIDVTYVLQIEY